jgi:hypothetical protein
MVNHDRKNNFDREASGSGLKGLTPQWRQLAAKKIKIQRQTCEPANQVTSRVNYASRLLAAVLRSMVDMTVTAITSGSLLLSLFGAKRFL